MRAWQYTSTAGGLEKNLVLSDSAHTPFFLFDNEILVALAETSLNPADFKVPEVGALSLPRIPVAATPGMDFAGEIVAIGRKVDWFRIGERVYGRVESGGTLAEFVVVRPKDLCISMPPTLFPHDAATLGTAGLTAWQTIVPNVKPGDRVFIHGGSGGTGTFQIQIARSLGCHVVTSCSSSKAGTCKNLGADETVDYTTTDVAKKLSEEGQVYSLVVDNVGFPADLYKASNAFLTPTGKFVQVGGTVSWADAKSVASRLLVPGFLGGGSRKFELFSIKTSKGVEDLRALAKWINEGKVKPVIDETFEFDDAPKAIEKLKSGHATGKIVVHIGKA
jgi:NADPH:quinone reductase-like Zn-dependent oxidoreductase